MSSAVASVGTGALSVDPAVVTVVLAMAAATMLTKVGGLWFLSRVEVSERVEAGLAVLPGAIVVAILAPELLSGGPREWAAAGVAAATMARTENILLALLAGVLTVVALRSLAV